ncbi:bacillithiol biosynthesis cysteine-adding enzyme BshC [Lysinibacillus piscis]|uniref:Putative cysteine ligase BshC n=1 Tax=Lysinibacillus piscis TaxID=2518931 RepID=A0ABQ5NHL7_9BACI|nr:bacillithiol biosynthesis cysteine-adding enzyme BshC [Lysinibacillus sp. KH24]GLC87561.1 putative cysteine ligase BshC [Lysinibacillus sp. KH24]
MKLELVQAPIKNRIVADYWLSNTAIHEFFDYEYSDQAFEERAHYLQQQAKNQTAVATVIRQFMEPLGISEKINEHIQQLEQGALAVVGGQQAGVLTGPLYSVHKAISVIVLAKEQSAKLQQPVVPLFWIAGEDHDLEEINHTYTMHGGDVKKRTYSERSKRKLLASATAINKEVMTEFIHSVVHDFGETAHTEALIKKLVTAANHSETLTEFFARLMNDLFKEEGLLLIDAADFQFRQYESDYFTRIIQKNEEIAQVVTAKEQALQEAGYGQPIMATEEAANLFLVVDGERHLLERKNGQFINVAANIKLSQEELLTIAHQHPERLSNNVVTRPLMQEMMLPVLAFVGGPGELAYWATLKDAFAVLDLQMPIFAPRLHITLVTRQVEQLLQEHQLTASDIWVGQAQQLQEQFIADIQDVEAKQQIQALQQLLVEKYDVLQTYLQTQALPLDKIIVKNKENHLKQFAYLQQKIEQITIQKHDATVQRFKTLQNELYPNDGFQERTYNPYQYLNEFGPTLITDMLKQNYQMGNQHYLLYL